MPVPAEESGQTAIEQVTENFDELEKEAGAKEDDIEFLKGLLENTILSSLIKIDDQLEGDEKPEPVNKENITLVLDILSGLKDHEEDDAVAELNQILEDKHFRGLIEAHDDIANKHYEVDLDALLPVDGEPPAVGNADAIRMVGIRKSADEPLGITVTVENGELVIARIMTGSMVDKQGLLHVGDIVKEVNGQEVTTPEGLMDVIRKTSGSITLKVIPSYVDHSPGAPVYMRAHFTFDPKKDTLIPSKDGGLAFQKGDILQITSKDDKSWWQAKKYNTDATGIIPSQAMEEKRKAIIQPQDDKEKSSLLCGWARKKKKGSYTVAKSGQYDQHELPTYEEVARLPSGFKRKALVLMGAQGIGRRSLKNRMVENDPDKFAAVVPSTSRPPREGEEDGKTYFFCDKADMERDIKAGKFLEHGEYGGNFYGTKLATVSDIIKSDKTCVLDVNTQAMKQLRTGEFMPYIVFIGAPNVDSLRKMHIEGKNKGAVTQDKLDRDFQRLNEESAKMERTYGHYFDATIVNSDFDRTYQELKTLASRLGQDPTWVPVSWATNLNAQM